LSVPEHVYTPPVVNNMVEVPVPQQTKRKFVNLSVPVLKKFIKFQIFKNFKKFQNFHKISKF
jgi:hypothetical protein